MHDLAADLLSKNAAALERFAGHRFFQDAAAGRLPSEVRDRYFRYERHFVRHAATIVALLLSKAPSLSAQRHLNQMLYGLLYDQLAVFDGIFLELGLDAAGPFPQEVDAFCNGMTEIARQGSYAEGVAAMLVAETTYAQVSCGIMRRSPPPDPHLRAWFELHADVAFLEGAEWLASELNRVGSKLQATISLNVVVENAVELEVQFHDAAYTLT